MPRGAVRELVLATSNRNKAAEFVRLLSAIPVEVRTLAEFAGVTAVEEIGTTLAGLFTRETPVNQLMGPVAIAEISGATAQLGWVALLSLMAMISLNLGLLNLMPIPVLDGGHIAILALEGLARRDFSVKHKERVLMVGLVAVVPTSMPITMAAAWFSEMVPVLTAVSATAIPALDD